MPLGYVCTVKNVVVCQNCETLGRWWI